MLTLRLFKLGYVWGIDLKRAAKLINSSSRVIRAKVEDPVRNIGEPDLYGMGYSFERMFSLFPTQANGTVCIGVAAAPIEDNFFAKTSGFDSVLITLFQADEFCEKSGRTKEEYIVHTMLCQLLWLQYKSRRPLAAHNELFHEATRGCIFDFCYNKADIAVGLRACLIDPICKGRLIEANIPESLVSDAERVLERIRMPAFLESLRVGLQKPLFSFLLGGFLFGFIINVLASLALGEFDDTSDYYVVLLFASLAFLLILGNYIQMLISSRRPNL